MARPKKEIDQKAFESLCGIQCTYEEICDFFDVTDKTLNRWCRETYGKRFSDVFRAKRGVGKISLRRSGFEMAKKNPAVHIFYAKNFLGMTDKQDVVMHEVEDLTPLADMLKIGLEREEDDDNSVD